MFLLIIAVIVVAVIVVARAKKTKQNFVQKITQVIKAHLLPNGTEPVDASHFRNLPVPFLSQRKNTYVWKEGTREVSMACKSCNITCIAMLLHYFGIKSDTSDTLETPDAMMKDYFTHLDDFAALADENHPASSDNIAASYNTADAFIWWGTMKYFVEIRYGAFCKPKLYNATSTIENLEKDVAAGYPVMMSIGSTEVGTDRGHIVVVRGFTKISGTEYIILNDPWGHVTNVETSNAAHSARTDDEKTWYLYDNNGDDGDNVILKVTEFKKMIAGEKIPRAMVIYAPLWQYPDGEKIDTADNENIIENNDKIIKDEGFPINGEALHNGIHLKQNEVRSIGTGRLLAVRNKDAINGSASFMLVQHQFAEIEGKNGTEIELGKLLTFNALYMHTACIPIKVCADTYFKTGKLPDEHNFKWLLQLFSSMLPHVRVIANKDTRTMGEFVDADADTDGYKAQGIFNATVEGSELVQGETSQDNQVHGRRMLVHLLPANDLFQKLLDPVNYSDPDFQDEMLDSTNFVKIDSNDIAYIFFHNSNANITTAVAASSENNEIEPEIFCSIDDGDDTFFTIRGTVNEKVFRRNAEKLSQLYIDGSANSGKVVAFDDLVNFPVENGGISADAYLDSKTSSFFSDNTIEKTIEKFTDLESDLKNTDSKQKAHWDTKFRGRIGNDDTFLMTDNFFNTMHDISLDLVLSYKDSNDSNTSIYTKLNEYFNGDKAYFEGDEEAFQGYKEARCVQLSSFLDNLSPSPSDNQAKGTWEYHLRTTLNDCLSKIKTE